jgi:hypothetical protein
MAIEFVTRVVDILRKLEIPYMVVGSFSSNVHGKPRSTKDADFVIELGSRSVFEISQELGPDFTLDSQMSFETVTATMRYRVAHPATSFMIEFFLLSDDPHDRERFGRKISGDIGDGRSTFVPRAEDVIITKLRWSKHGLRQKDVLDAAGIIAVQAGRLDLNYIRRWCDVHGTRDLFEAQLRQQPHVD